MHTKFNIIFSKKFFIFLIATAACLLLSASLIKIKHDEKPEIKTAEINNIRAGTLKGKNINNSKEILQTKSKLVYQSKEIQPTIKGANAAVLKWDQSGSEEGAELELRTQNNGKWSEWNRSSEAEDRKDNTPAPHSALVIGTNIEKIQYRFTLQPPTGGTSSPQVNLEKSSIEMIDSTKGPSPTKPDNLLEKLIGGLGFSKVLARMDGPHIYTRAEWGSPEPNSSPRWEPEYKPLYRVIIHHTVTPNDADPGATIRAIWQYHANSNGWGDIGYNYLVDANGNIFQGRYFDPAVTGALRQDVVGGHAYGNNQGTSGIAALGDFSNVRPNDRMVDAIADLTAYKAANYNFNPSGIGPAGPNVVGHRDVVSTGCPGDQLYARLSEIRNIGDIYYGPRVAMNRFDLGNKGQGFNNSSAVETSIMAGQSTQAYFDLKNEGDETWQNGGANPVVLATDQPRDRGSSFATAGSWRSANRAATFSHKVVFNSDGTKTLTPTTTIAPGETGRFNFTMTAPASAGGDYREHFQLIAEGREWFTRNLLLSTTIHVTPQIYAWRPVGQHIFTDDQQTTPSHTGLSPGQRVYLVLKAENTGNQTWYKDGTSPVRVATSNPRDRTSGFCDATWIHCARPSSFQEASVAPGQVGSFGFWLRAPSPSANFSYNEHFSLVAEGKTWMNTEPGVYWPVVVQN